jgi:membrane-associated protein
MIDLLGVASVADLLAFIREHGNAVYLFAFVFAFARTGFLPPILAGYVAQQGALDPLWTFLVFWIGSLLGDEMRFFIGRRWGRSILARVPAMQRPVEIVIAVLNAYPTGFILTYRFARGMRSVAAVALGMMPIAWSRFSALNVVGAALWASVFTGIGYSLGHVSEKVLGDAANWGTLVLLGIFLLIGWLISRRLPIPQPQSR